MTHNWLLYIAAFACSFAVSLLMTPTARKISIKLKAIDYPKARGLHKEPIPRMGGIAIVLGFMASMVMLTFFMPEIRTRQFAGFLIGGLMIVALGMIDDIYHLRARWKLIGQIVVALVVVMTGTRVEFIEWPIPDFLDRMDIPVTMIWVVGLINAVNFIDGVDGLAAGVSSIAGISLTALCIISGSPIAVVFATTLAGSCLGFLPRNFSPADVIMGDTGALFLGYVLAVTSIIGVFKGYALLAVVIAVLVLALPIFDTAFAILRRMFNRKPIMKADRGHMHHRLIDHGFSHKQTVVILYILSAIMGVVAVLIAIRDLRATIIVAVSIVVLFLMIYAYRKRVDK